MTARRIFIPKFAEKISTGGIMKKVFRLRVSEIRFSSLNKFFKNPVCAE